MQFNSAIHFQTKRPALSPPNWRQPCALMSAAGLSLRPRAKVARRSSRLRAEAPVWPEGWATKRKSADAGLDDPPDNLSPSGTSFAGVAGAAAGVAHGPADVENETTEASPIKRQRSHSTSPGGTRRRALRPSWSVPRAKQAAKPPFGSPKPSPVKSAEVRRRMGTRRAHDTRVDWRWCGHVVLPTTASIYAFGWGEEVHTCVYKTYVPRALANSRTRDDLLTGSDDRAQVQVHV